MIHMNCEILLTPAVIVIGQKIEAAQQSLCVHARLLYRLRTQKCMNPFWSFWSILWPIAMRWSLAPQKLTLPLIFGVTDSGGKGCYQAKITETEQEKAYSSVKYLKEQWSCDAWNPSCIDLGVKASSSFIQQQQHPGRSNTERLMEWLHPFIPT